MGEAASLAEELARVKGERDAAVEDAYREGFRDGLSEGHPLANGPSETAFWLRSDARAALAQQETRDE